MRNAIRVIHLSFAALLAIFLMCALPVTHAAERITYYHTDALGSPTAATDQQGNVVWRETYEPYGERIKKEPASSTNARWHTGHVLDAETGLQYAGARYYDPVLGRFMGIDPQGFSQGDPHSFNRYAYGNNNPYKYIDPNGEWVVPAIAWAIGVGSAIHEMSRPVTLDAHGDAGLVSIPTFPGPVGGINAGSKLGKEGTEIVQRAMSRAEAGSIRGSGVLSRGGRSGEHHVSDSVNSNAERARQRLALGETPEVRVTLEVPKGVFSQPSKVAPKNNMPGGGMERTAPGSLDVPSKIRGVHEF